MWESAHRSLKDLAGVFEFDGEVGYFYLYRELAEENKKVGGAIHVISGRPDFTQADLAIAWDREEVFVGLFIRATLWAAFDSRSGEKYGGDYKIQSGPKIPLEITERFR